MLDERWCAQEELVELKAVRGMQGKIKLKAGRGIQGRRLRCESKGTRGVCQRERYKNERERDTSR
jgi:hypothetical protein